MRPSARSGGGSIAVPEQGQLVEVRTRAWVVADVEASGLDAPSLDPLRPRQNLVTLRSVEDDAEPDETLRVVWEIEPGARVLDRAGFPLPDHLDDPTLFAAFLDAVRWGSISATNPGQLLAPFQSGITIEGYQLDPLARAIEMPQVALLIADDVGLGKTIEAGLIAKELLLRYRARRMLIVAPADLTLQWRDEMQDRFGLEFRVVDRALQQRLRREGGIHANAWTHFPRLITSVEYLRQERVLRRFRETLPAPGEPRLPRRWDLLIVDEAHNIAPSGGGHWARPSQRTATIREIAPHFEHRLFLTATPHNGHDESFTALLEMLDPQRFLRSVPPSEEQKRRVMVRRLKSELPPDFDGRPRFPPRRMVEIEVEADEGERQAHADLRRYAELRTTDTPGGHGAAGDFVLLLLKKRLLSSPRAFLNTLQVHRATLADTGRSSRPAASAPAVLREYMDRVEQAFVDDAERDEAEDLTHRTAARVLPPLRPAESAILDELAAWATRAAGRPDARAEALIELIERVCRPDGRWGDERLIVFTEYRDTQNWLFELLDARGLTGDGRVALLWGGMDDDGRAEVKAAFQAADAPVRVLLGTDAASEGINLQRQCHRVVHYEIPWNPVRLEQRNGRVDRHGQRADEVLVHHFVPAGYRELGRLEEVPAGRLDGELEFLRRVAVKVESIRDMLGNVGPVIGDQLREAMLGRRRRLETGTAEVRGERVRRQLRFEQRIDERIAQMVRSLNDTRAELRLDPEHLRTVVEVGLRLARQPALSPAREEGTFTMPALTGDWARCTVGLAHPYTGAVRPITFDETVARGRDDMVLCHGGHPLVQTAVRRLRAQVFAPDGGSGSLARMSAGVVADPRLDAPLAVAYARLVVVGAEGHRLHEEIIQAGGLVTEGRLRRIDSPNALADLLSLPVVRPVSDAAEARIVRLHPDLVDALDGALVSRARDRSRSLVETIERRMRDEVERSRAVLEELRAQIETELHREHEQLSLWEADERRQLGLDREFLRARLGRIPEEIEEEARRLAERFRTPTERVFPIAIEYRLPAALADR
ncbi:MAG: DISARM system SNF2-like helicase DrmD [Thermoleophilia bacterium]